MIYVKWEGAPSPIYRQQRIQAGNGYIYGLNHKVVSPLYILLQHELLIEALRTQSPSLLQQVWSMNPPKTTMKECLPELKKRIEDMRMDYRDGKEMGAVGSVFAALQTFVPLLVSTNPLRGKPPLSEQDMTEIKMNGRLESIRWWSIYGAWDHGAQTFIIEPALADKLLLTDTTHLKWDDFKLPFPGFIIQVPNYLITLKDLETGEHHLDTIIVNTSYSEEFGRAITLLFMGQENEGSRGPGDDTTLYLNLFSKRDGKDFDSLEESIQYMTREEPGWMRDPISAHGAKGSIHLAAQLAINIITYIASRPEDVVLKPLTPRQAALKDKVKRLTGKKRQRALGRLRSFGRQPFVVGTKVKLCHQLAKVAEHCGHGHSPSVASYVRGHWKNQPHGPQRQLRKLIWLEPHWRNLGAENASQKTYTVA